MRFFILTLSFLISTYLLIIILKKISISNSIKNYLHSLKNIHKLNKNQTHNQIIFNNISLSGIILLFKIFLVSLPYIINYFLIINFDFNQFSALCFPLIIYLPTLRSRFN